MVRKVSPVKRLIDGQHVTDGAGVHLNRLIASNKVPDIDPFVLLDEFKSDDPDDYIKGFPWHPHRGIETITYMVQGKFRHEDSRGGGGILNPGEIQWMTAGRGILHQEMPEMKDGMLWGYQLWLNLSARDKMVPPRYQHLPADEVPVVDHDGTHVLVIAGKYSHTEGMADTHYPINYFDVNIKEGAIFRHIPGEGMSKFIYVHSGTVVVDPKGEETEVHAGSMAILGDGLQVVVGGRVEKSGFLFLAGSPHNEPIARGGPFVMNTQEEIRQAWEDFQNGVLF